MHHVPVELELQQLVAGAEVQDVAGHLRGEGGLHGGVVLVCRRARVGNEWLGPRSARLQRRLAPDVVAVEPRPEARLHEGLLDRQRLHAVRPAALEVSAVTCHPTWVASALAQQPVARSHCDGLISGSQCEDPGIDVVGLPTQPRQLLLAEVPIGVFANDALVDREKTQGVLHALG